ncbi:AEC family transporter [Flintibacter sp.]|uniref:AEC family transporter n=1 Tax=Flintibacter sp. TaxID=1918624 RepID=UPI003A1CE0CD
MDALLIKTGGLLLIVALGYLLKRRGVFQQGDARLLSRIIVNLTLPGALLSSFSEFRLVPSLLAVLAAAAAANVLLLAVSALVTRGRPGPVRALYLLNAPSYNIGTFVLPFVQSFLPPDMLLAVSMFDAGNSPFNCGGAYALTAALTGGERLTLRSVLGVLRPRPLTPFWSSCSWGCSACACRSRFTPWRGCSVRPTPFWRC